MDKVQTINTLQAEIVELKKKRQNLKGKTLRQLNVEIEHLEDQLRMLQANKKEERNP